MWCAAMHCAFESHPLRQQRDKLNAYLFFCFVIKVFGNGTHRSFFAIIFNKHQFDRKS